MKGCARVNLGHRGNVRSGCVARPSPQSSTRDDRYKVARRVRNDDIIAAESRTVTHRRRVVGNLHRVRVVVHQADLKKALYTIQPL